MRRRRGYAWTALCCFILAGVASAQGEPKEDPAAVAVAASLEVEQALLDEDRESYLDLVRKRDDVNARWELVHHALDLAVGSDEPGTVTAIERLTTQLEQTEGERAELRAAERVLIERIRDRLRRIALFEVRLEALRGRPRPEGGTLTGTWDVVLLPTEQRGSFELSQTGAIVTGTYRLNGGFSGSLRGTLVKTKLYLERIDSQLGRSMELEGRLSTDQQTILGTWLSYELADGDGSNGHWSATRRSRGGDADPDDGG